VKKYLHYLFLLIIVGLVTLINFFWLKADFAPPSGDANAHLLLTIDFWDLIYSNDFWAVKLGKVIFFSTGAYPPLVYWLSFVFYRLFGLSTFTAIMGQGLFILIFVISIYQIGKTLWNPTVGLIMALVGAGSPLFIIYSRTFLLDFPLLALFTCGYACLIAAKNFQNRRASLALGVALALGMLTKWALVYFMLLPLAVIALPIFWKGFPKLGAKLVLMFSFLAALIVGVFFSVKGFGRLALLPYFLFMLGLGFVISQWSKKSEQENQAPDEESEKAPFLNLLQSFWIFLLICGGWYLIYSSQIIERLFYQVNVSGTYVPFLNRLLLNFNTIFLTYPFSLIFFLIGLVISLWNPQDRKKNWITLLNLLFSFLLIAITLPFDSRYILPAFPLVLQISLFWITRNKWLTPFLCGFLILASLLQLNGYWLAERKLIPQPLSPFIKTISLNEEGATIAAPHWLKSNALLIFTSPPDSARYNQEKTMELILRSSRKKVTGIGIYNNLDKAPVQGRSLFLTCRLKHYKNIELISMEDEQINYPAQKLQFILMISNQNSDFISWQKQAEKRLGEKLKLLQEFPLKDRFIIRIFQRESLACSKKA